ncbi:TAXI family TRAP transporter solute-binding subunit [Clostridium formicaceticum]|uniref:ABC transporter, phosphonate, periplasmic substrate-binding protein n=1 Tax=Clostridium formicaceticum TaxID=1497 RepID=A0AAC9RMP9_9CLOT|nr:TAXI family TRAP transporter solute-binding subunit [Clostridium formicaceticum]AOY77907.1 C4-dicarboxylate ABC transporter substrate-binding protein [Clostridium formicaceticum]ARE88524.1 ABC transporter, phosphonate, periplasmic substrate-binding protein [Clostridium formicaceticum]
MKKVLLLILISLMILSGCATKPSENMAQNETGGKEAVTINIPTAATTGALYPLGSSIANLWSNDLDYVRASAQASNGGIDNLNLLQSGEAQVSMAVTSVMYQSYKGEATFEGRPNEKLRVISGLYYNPNQVVVRKESNINSLQDIVGKNFASGAPGSTTEVETNLHLTEAGINYPDGLKVQFIGFTEAIDLMRNKQLDGAWIMAGLPTAAVTEITTTAGGKLVSIEGDVITKLQEKYPWYAKYTIPAGTYDGQEEDVTTTAIKMAMFTTADLSEDVVYDLTKSFWENIDTLKQSNNALKDLTIEDAVTDLAGLPLHDGAIKYYKEVGVLK